MDQRTSIDLFRRLRPWFSGENGHPDESIIDRPQNPEFREILNFTKKHYFYYLNVGDCTRGNENDSSSRIRVDMTHFTIIIPPTFIINMIPTRIH